jgi:Protein O-mannosyl-transferase TMEM260-like/Tetratricopeptide repeat
MGWVDPGSGFKKSINTLLGFLLFIFTFSFFLGNLCPSLYWRDPGEFAALAFTLSVGHPTGSPTYSLIAKLFTFLPFGSLWQKINLASVVFGSLTVSIGFLLILRLLRKDDADFPQKQTFAFFSAAAASLLLAFSPTFWLYSLVAKAYPYLTFWILILIWLLLGFREEAQKSPSPLPLSPQAQSYFFAAAFLYGLGLGVYGAMALYLPAFLFYCFYTDRRWYRDPKILFLGGFFFLLGFSVYLYLPLRSSTNPFLDWGEPRTFSRFLNHLMDAKDASHNASFPDWPTIGKMSLDSLRLLSDQFSPLGLFLGGIGLIFLWHRDKACFSLTLGIALIHWLFFVRIWKMAFLYLPLFLIFSLWIGTGIFFLGKAIAFRPWKKARPGFQRAMSWAWAGAIVFTLIFQYALHKPSSGKGDYYVAYALGKEMLGSLPPKTLLFSNYSTMLFHGLQGVENFRSDVSVAVIFPLRNPHLFWSIDPAHYPAFDYSKLPRVVHPNTQEFFQTLITAHQGKYPLFWDLGAEDNWLISRLVPRGLLYQIQEKEIATSQDELSMDQKKTYEFFQSLSSLEGFEEDEEGRQLLKNLTNMKSIYFMRTGFPSFALSYNRIAMQLFEDDPTLHNNRGIIYHAMGKNEEALQLLQKVVDRYPLDPLAHLNRGAIFEAQGENAQALREWKEASRLGGKGVLGYYNRGKLLLKMGKTEEALSEFNAFLEKSWVLLYLSDHPILEEVKERVKEIEKRIQEKKNP